MVSRFVILALLAAPSGLEAYSAACLAASSQLDREWDHGNRNAGGRLAMSLIRHAEKPDEKDLALPRSGSAVEAGYRLCRDEIGSQAFFELVARNLHPANWGHVDQVLNRMAGSQRASLMRGLDQWRGGLKLRGISELLSASGDGWSANTLRSAYNSDGDMLFEWVANRLNPACDWGAAATTLSMKRSGGLGSMFATLRGTSGDGGASGLLAKERPRQGPKKGLVAACYKEDPARFSQLMGAKNSGKQSR